MFQDPFEIDVGFSLGGLTVSLKFTACCWHSAYLTFFFGATSGVLSVWFKMCLSFLSVWCRVDSELGQWLIADWLKVGAKFYLKSVHGLIRNLSKIHLSFRFGFGFVLGWVNPLLGIRFKVYLRSVEILQVAWGLTLRCACSFLREGFRIYCFIYLYIYT